MKIEWTPIHFLGDVFLPSHSSDLKVPNKRYVRLPRSASLEAVYYIYLV